MSDYTAPVRDMRFVLEHLAGCPSSPNSTPSRTPTPTWSARCSRRPAGSARRPWPRPTGRGRAGTPLSEDGEITLPDSFKRVYDQYVEAGWAALSQPTEFGGGGFPLVVSSAFKEMLDFANLAFSLGPLLTTGAV